MRVNKSYAVTICCHINATTDRQAMVKAALIAEGVRDKENIHTQVLRLNDTSLAPFKIRHVHTGKLTMFKGKLLEA